MMTFQFDNKFQLFETDDRRTFDRQQPLNAFRSQLVFSDLIAPEFTGEIMNESQSGYKIRVKNMILPAGQLLEIRKKTIDQQVVKIHCQILWSNEVILNGESYTEFGLKI